MQTSNKRQWIKKPQYWDCDHSSIKDYRKRANKKFRRQNKQGLETEIVTISAGYFW